MTTYRVGNHQPQNVYRDDQPGERYVIAYGKGPWVMVKDRLTGETLGTWFSSDALLNATEMLARLRSEAQS